MDYILAPLFPKRAGFNEHLQEDRRRGEDTALSVYWTRYAPPPPFFLRILYLVLAVRKNPGERVKKQTLRWQNFRTELGAQ